MTMVVWSTSSLGFDIVLGGELEDSRRGSDLRFWWLQDRIWVGCLPAGEGITEVAPNRVFPMHP